WERGLTAFETAKALRKPAIVLGTASAIGGAAGTVIDGKEVVEEVVKPGGNISDKGKNLGEFALNFLMTLTGLKGALKDHLPKQSSQKTPTLPHVKVVEGKKGRVREPVVSEAIPEAGANPQEKMREREKAEAIVQEWEAREAQEREETAREEALER